MAKIFRNSAFFSGLFSDIFKECNFEKTLLSDYLAQNIIAQICKDLFSNHKTLKNLLKSPPFFKELHGIFSNFTLNSVNIKELEEAALSLHETDKNRLIPIIKVYEKYIETLDKNDFLDNAHACSFLIENFEKIEIYKSEEPVFVNRYDELSEKQIVLLEMLYKDVFLAKKTEITAKQQESYIFEDILGEIEGIAEKIKSFVNSGAKFSEIGIFLRGNNARQKIAGLFKTLGIPTDASISSENFENFKRMLSRNFKICKILENMGIDDFSTNGFSLMRQISRSQDEILNEELNFHLKNLITDTLEDSFARDRLLAMQDLNHPFLNVIYANIELLSEPQKEALIKEIVALKSFYTLYLDENFMDAISVAAKRFNIEKETLTPILGRVKGVFGIYKNIFETKLSADVLIELIENSDENKAPEGDFVSICPFGTHKTFKYVFIPSMTENVLPQTNNSVNLLSPDGNLKLSQILCSNHTRYKFFTKTDEYHLENEQKLFNDAVFCAKEYICFSTHTFEDKKQCSASAYFLQSAKSPVFVEKKQENNAKLYPNSTAVQPQTKCVISNDDTLKLNPSVVSTYLKCPKRYYYKGLLNLKEQSTFAANYGNIVHAVMEVFLNKCLDKYNKQAMLVLSDILFNSVEEPETALEAGFSELVIDLIRATEKLALAQMRMNFENAVDELDKNGWFSTPPEKAYTEVSFSYKTPELENVLFDGRIDAILEKNGEFSIIDFKTGKDKDNDLNYAISEYGVNFFTRTGKMPANIEDYKKKYDYQIPLYYLASKNAQNLKDFQGKISRLGLEYIRPKNIHGGCRSDFVPADTVETYKFRIMENLKKTVIDKIREAEEFEQADNIQCAGCTYACLCDREEGE